MMKPKYYISLTEAKKITNELLQTKIDGMKLFLNHFPECKKMKIETPKVLWRGMGYRAAGCIYLDDHIIEMNSNYLSSPSYKKFMHATFIHELGHSIAYDLFKDQGHGKAWKLITSFLGDDNGIYHNYEFPTINKVERKSDLQSLIKHYILYGET